jgi:hypothetical protein
MPDEDLFDLDDYIAENAKEPYRFKRGGQTFSLPHFSDVDWRIAEAAESGQVGALREIFRRSFGEDQWAEFENYPQPSGAIGELFRRWQKHAGLKPGESQGSAGSSGSTAGPSTRRSAGTGSRSGRRSPGK